MRIANAGEVKNLKAAVTKVMASEVSKSAKIKALFTLGLEVKAISEVMGVRYQFAYNVVSNYVNINEVEVVSEVKVSKKAEVIKLYLEGNTNITISKLLKTNYNYVYKIIKEYALQQQQQAK